MSIVASPSDDNNKIILISDSGKLYTIDEFLKQICEKNSK